jgi:hypothetical protein
VHARELRSCRFALAGCLLVGTVAGAAAACGTRPALTQMLEARRLAAELHVQFTRSSEAATRAVMAETEEASAAAADEARQTRAIVERNLDSLQRVLQSLGYTDDLRLLEGFKTRFEEYRRLDDEILSLAVENTNVKAQRLAFGPAKDAADLFRTSLEAAVRSSGSRENCHAELLAANARLALLEIETLQAPHIAEASDATMDEIEKRMAAAEASARRVLEQLKTTVPEAARPQIAAATAALDRFESINGEIVTLSRRNSNVRSLALSLGRKRAVTAECEDQLRALEEAIASHKFTATR